MKILLFLCLVVFLSRAGGANVRTPATGCPVAGGAWTCYGLEQGGQNGGGPRGFKVTCSNPRRSVISCLSGNPHHSSVYNGNKQAQYYTDLLTNIVCPRINAVSGQLGGFSREKKATHLVKPWCEVDKSHKEHRCFTTDDYNTLKQHRQASIPPYGTVKYGEGPRSKKGRGFTQVDYKDKSHITVYYLMDGKGEVRWEEEFNC